MEGLSIETRGGSYMQDAPDNVRQLVKKGPKELKTFCFVKKNLAISLRKEWRETMQQPIRQISPEKIEDFIISYEVITKNTDVAIQAAKVFLGRRRIIKVWCFRIEYGMFISQIIGFCALLCSAVSIGLGVYSVPTEDTEDAKQTAFQFLIALSIGAKMFLDRLREQLFNKYEKEQEEIDGPLLALLGAEEQNLSILEDEYTMLENIQTAIERSRKTGVDFSKSGTSPVDLDDVTVALADKQAVFDKYIEKTWCGQIYVLKVDTVEDLVEDILSIKTRVKETLEYSEYIKGRRIPILSGILANLERHKGILEEKLPELKALVEMKEIDYESPKIRSYIRMATDGINACLALVQLVADFFSSSMQVIQIMNLSLSTLTAIMTAFDSYIEKIYEKLGKQKKVLLQANNEQNLLQTVQTSIDTFKTYERLRKGLSSDVDVVDTARNMSSKWAKAMSKLSDLIAEKRETGDASMALAEPREEEKEPDERREPAQLSPSLRPALRVTAPHPADSAAATRGSADSPTYPWLWPAPPPSEAPRNPLGRRQRAARVVDIGSDEEASPDLEERRIEGAVNRSLRRNSCAAQISIEEFKRGLRRSSSQSLESSRSTPHLRS